MQLRKETNLYDDEAVANALQDERDYAQSLNSKFSATYGTCTTVSSTAAKIVSLSGFVLFTGAKITVKFNNANSAANPTLNVNGTGAKPIWARNAVIAEQYYWTSQARIDFVYDGEHWMMTDAKSQEEIFAEFTNNGAIRGIFMQNSQMYVNMDYLQTGTLKLGGSSNGNGVMEVFNSSGTRIGRWDNTALYIGNISSALTSPNTKISTTGAITTNSLTANSYIRIDGAYGSYFKLLFNSDGDAYLEINASSSSPIKLIDDNCTAYVGATYGFEVWEDSNKTRYGKLTSRILSLSSLTSSVSLSVTSSTCLEYYEGSTRKAYFGGAGIYTAGQISCGGTKSRVVDTQDYGERLLYCYETPSPMFGDVGEGTISGDGKCYVQIDSVFAETVSLSQYQVFLQKYGDGECYVSERYGSYFVVEGTPGLVFGWELKAKQADFDQYRLEADIGTISTENTIDYGAELARHINEIQNEREVAAA